MNALVFGHDKSIAEWVGAQIGKPFSEPFTAVGVLGKNGKLTGGVVFTSYDTYSIELSLAGRGVASRPLWAAILHYVFEQCSCSRLGIVTSAKNTNVRRMAPKLGFKFEGTLRRKFGAVNGLVYSLTIDDLPAFRKKWKI